MTEQQIHNIIIEALELKKTVIYGKQAMRNYQRKMSNIHKEYKEAYYDQIIYKKN